MPKDMSGSIGRNKDKKTEKHPDYKGSCQIDGVGYWISGWIRREEDGGHWLSLAFSQKSAKEAKVVKPDDDMPF